MALRLRQAWRRHGRDMLLVSPFFALFALFGAWPVLRSAWLGFTRYYAVDPPAWIGLANYEALFADERFWVALGNTSAYTLAVTLLNAALGLALALAFGGQSRLHQLARFAFFLPALAGGVGAIAAWKWMAHSESYGLFNALRGWFGLPPLRFLGDPALALPILVAVGVWSAAGYSMMLFVAGLRSIPADLYEAATLDGAGRWQRFFFVTLPMLRPTLLYVVITGMIASFQVFYEPYLLYGSVDAIGGPLDSALMLVTYVFDHGFRQLDLGYASAAAWVMTVILFALAWLHLRLAGDGR